MADQLRIIRSFDGHLNPHWFSDGDDDDEFDLEDNMGQRNAHVADELPVSVPRGYMGKGYKKGAY